MTSTNPRVTSLKWTTATVGITALIGSVAMAEFIGPSEYRSLADSPFTDLDFEYFHLEDFEDALFNVPGVSKSSGDVHYNSTTTDSVDGDDGTIDGCGASGHSLLSLDSSSGIQFDFDATELGNYPTHVGVAWTDSGYAEVDVLFEAFDADGQLIGTLVGDDLSDNSVFCTTDEDRFFGIVCMTGISSVRVWNDDGNGTPGIGIEVDHLQYGYMPFVPEGCPGDTNGDATVNEADLVNVITDWGTDGSGNGGDVSGPGNGAPDCHVDVYDLIAVIVTWFECE